MNNLHTLGIFLTVLNAVVAAVATDPIRYGINNDIAGPWLALVVLSIGIVLKELPSAAQQSEINTLRTNLVYKHREP